MMIRALNSVEQQALRLARLVAVERMPYFARALFAVEGVAAEGLGTFGVDERWRLYVDPDLLVGERRWPPEVAGAVLLHEVGHLLREHAARARGLRQPVSMTAWNYAADAEINDDLLAAGVPLPDGAITPESLGCEVGGVAEDYYEAIANATDDSAAAHGCGSGSGSGPLEGELEATSAGAEGIPVGLDASMAGVRRRLVAQDVMRYPVGGDGGAGRGDLPAGVKRWARELLTAPQVPWTSVLTATVRRAVHERAGHVNYSYRRPGRRRIPGVLLPGMVAPRLNVAIVIDTSGSMSSTDLGVALTETRGVLATASVERVVTMTCDAATSVPVPLRDPRRIELLGGGGTDMRIGIAAAEALRPRPDVVIVMTDGDTDWPARCTRSALVVVVIGPRSGITAGCVPRWARVVAQGGSKPVAAVR